MKKNLRTASICVQGGYEPKNGEPIEVPIYQSTTFKYDNSEEMAMLFDLKKEGSDDASCIADCLEELYRQIRLHPYDGL